MNKRVYSGFAAILLSTLAGCSGVEERRASSAADAGAELSAQDIGRRAFQVCASCHSVKDPAKGSIPRLVGPNLFAIYGAMSANREDFAYSSVMRDANLVWDDQTLEAFIARPQAVVPGNRMSFAGVSDAERRAAIVEYLKTLK